MYLHLFPNFQFRFYLLCNKGEIFGGIHVGSYSNDGEVLMDLLGNCCACDSHENGRACEEKDKCSVSDVLSTIKGPWAIIFWQVSLRAELENHTF